MQHQFDPRRVLRSISNHLLRQLFAGRGELLDLPWEQLTEFKIEPIYEAWQNLADAPRGEILRLLQDINELDGERGISAIAELLAQRAPDKLLSFEAVEARADKAMWAWLNAPELFNLAAKLARADSLSQTRYWVRRGALPRQTVDGGEQTRESLARELATFYRKRQGRGHHCKVDYYQRANGADFFFAYLEDYPDRKQVFQAGGELVPQPDSSAFDNVFVFHGGDGTLEMYARGGKKVWGPLQQAFGRAALGVEIAADDASTVPYQLNGLLDPAFAFVTDPADGVSDVRIKRLRLVPHARPKRRVLLEADSERARDDIHAMVRDYLAANYLGRERVNVTMATLTVTCRGGTDIERSFSFDISYPHSCSLKSLLDHQRVIGERCLKLSNIDVA